MQAGKIELVRNYAIAGEVTIYPSELRQVFTNLITNAIDAIGQKGRLSIAIEEAPDHQVVVKVRDTGCGIPQENLKVIFEPFFSTKGEQGTGIGLWVIKGIVDKLGGKVQVESSTTGETGTCFSIFLPANHRAAKNEDEHGTAAMPTKASVVAGRLSSEVLVIAAVQAEPTILVTHSAQRPLAVQLVLQLDGRELRRRHVG